MLSNYFCRPANIQYPNVWMTFEAPDLNGDLVKYRIQDLPEDRFEDGVQHMLSEYIREETFCVARNMANDEKAIADLTRIWRELIFNEKLTIACFKEGCGDIIGIHVLFIEREKFDIDWDRLASESVRDMDLICLYVSVSVRCLQTLPSRQLLRLSVNSAYRRRGIAKKLLETRKLLGKPYGLSLTSTAFSSPEAQKVALSYQELAKIDPRFDFKIKANAKLGIYSMRI